MGGGDDLDVRGFVTQGEGLIDDVHRPREGVLSLAARLFDRRGGADGKTR